MSKYRIDLAENLRIARSMVKGPGGKAALPVVYRVFARIPTHLLAALRDFGGSIYALGRTGSYVRASKTLRDLKINPAYWGVTPSGMYIQAERTVYVHDVAEGVIAHEIGHMVDAFFGKGPYLSASDVTLRSAYDAARSFVSYYSACGIDEFVAEGFRSMLSFDLAAFPPTSPERLKECSPYLYDLLDGIFTGRARPEERAA